MLEEFGQFSKIEGNHKIENAAANCCGEVSTLHMQERKQQSKSKAAVEQSRVKWCQNSLPPQNERTLKQ